jgi:hypothetical protein
MHSAAQEIAGRDVCFDGWPHIVSGKFDIESRSLHDRQRLPRLEAEPRVKAVGEQQRDGNAELLGRHLIDAQLDFRDLPYGRAIGFSPFRMRPV